VPQPPVTLLSSVAPPAPPLSYSSATTAHGRVAWREGVRWTEYDAYLFDIDGTLLRDPGRVHYHAFSKACLEVLGHPLSLDAISVQGSTDPRILRDAFAAAGIAESTWRPHQARLLASIATAVARDAAAMQIRVMPGVVQTLERLASGGKLLGVATGNLESIGWLKLEQAQLRAWFRFGGFSDAHEERAAMIAAAAAEARAQLHRGASPDDSQGASLVVVGDTPADIAAARANDIPVIAVATGHSSFDALLAHHPEVCAESLSALLLAEEAA
jgi:phosphoglycolate phosphatase